MISWVIVVLIVLGLMLFVKMSPGVRFGKLWTYVVGGTIVFFIFTFSYVIIKSNSDISSFSDFLNVMKIYFIYLGNLLDNIGRVTGSVVQTEWATNVTK